MPTPAKSYVKVNFPNNHRLHVGYTTVPNKIGTEMLREGIQPAYGYIRARSIESLPLWVY